GRRADHRHGCGGRDQPGVDRMPHKGIGPAVHHPVIGHALDTARPELAEVDSRPPGKQDSAKRERFHRPAERRGDRPQDRRGEAGDGVEQQEKAERDHGEMQPVFAVRGLDRRLASPDGRDVPGDEPGSPQGHGDEEEAPQHGHPYSGRERWLEGLERFPAAQDSFDFRGLYAHLPAIEAPRQRERRLKSPRPRLVFCEELPFSRGSFRNPRCRAPIGPRADAYIASSIPYMTFETPSHFEDLGLSQCVLQALELKGYGTPTPIQAQAIPHVLDGRDLLGIAQTGTGKTAAFMLPSIERLRAADKRPKPRSCRMLVLAPTRELAGQIADSARDYAKFAHLKIVTVFGGTSVSRNRQEVARGVDILIATPGRLVD